MILIGKIHFHFHICEKMITRYYSAIEIYSIIHDDHRMTKNSFISQCLSQVFGMNWRFLPLADPTVDIMMVRDLDSLFTDREVTNSLALALSR